MTAIVTSLRSRLRLVTGFNLGIEKLSDVIVIWTRSTLRKTRRELPVIQAAIRHKRKDVLSLFMKYGDCAAFFGTVGGPGPASADLA
jgi:hypothetical protein